MNPSKRECYISSFIIDFGDKGLTCSEYYDLWRWSFCEEGIKKIGGGERGKKSKE